ncbi:MAG: class I SAM-dependent methyltransferase [Myxococcota bacterium]
MADTLFSTIERLHADRPWGDVLDAGTGSHSLNWINSLSTRSWTAITGDDGRRDRMKQTFHEHIRPDDRILSGNWTDPALLVGEAFDVVLADYLLGALDGFAPYFQDQLFARLRRHVRDDGRLYVIGLAPYPDNADTPGGRIILEIARLRDACILLAGHRCYREYPLKWVIRHIDRSGFTVQEARTVDILYGPRFINGQLDVCLRKLKYFQDAELAQQMRQHIEEVRARALALPSAQGNGIRFGQDYVLWAKPKQRKRTSK